MCAMSARCREVRVGARGYRVDQGGHNRKPDEGVAECKAVQIKGERREAKRVPIQAALLLDQGPECRPQSPGPPPPSLAGPAGKS
jgi:hypothetical protein